MAVRLKAAGLIRVGRSRVWLKDGGWRLVVVELQPSSWSKGSYLNVATMFLLAPPQPDALRLISFDAGQGRIFAFHPITTTAEAEQAEGEFAPAVLAAIAEEDSRFGTIKSAAAELVNQRDKSLHGQYYAMLLLALTGRIVKAAKIAAVILDEPAPYEWIQTVQLNTRTAASLLEDRDGLERLLIGNIQARRADLGLEAISDTAIRSQLSE